MSETDSTEKNFTEGHSHSRKHSENANNGLFMFLGLVVAGGLIAASIMYTGGAFGKKSTGGTGTPNVKEDPSAPSSSVEGSNQTEKMASLAKNAGVDPEKFKSCLDTDKPKNEIKNDETDAAKYGANGTPTFFIGKSADKEIDAQMIVGAQPITVFEQVIDGWLKDGKPVEVAGSADAKLQKISLDDDAVLGDKNAPLMMVEFSDYECPFCQRHFQQTWPTIYDKYIKTGKLKLVFRDQIFHQAHDPNATLAAIAANCVREQGGDEAYYKFHDEYFTKSLSNGAGL